MRGQVTPERIAKLPEWAQEHIRGLEHSRERWQWEAEEARKMIDEDPSSPVAVVTAWELRTPLRLPPDVRFTFDIDCDRICVYLDKGGVVLMSEKGTPCVLPLGTKTLRIISSNAIEGRE